MVVSRSDFHNIVFGWYRDESPTNNGMMHSSVEHTRCCLVVADGGNDTLLYTTLCCLGAERECLQVLVDSRLLLVCPPAQNRPQHDNCIARFGLWECLLASDSYKKVSTRRHRIWAKSDDRSWMDPNRTNVLNIGSDPTRRYDNHTCHDHRRFRFWKVPSVPYCSSCCCCCCCCCFWHRRYRRRLVVVAATTRCKKRGSLT